MSTITSLITNRTIVYSTVYADADQRKHQSPASLAFVRGIHRRPVNSPHKWPVTRKMFPFDDVIMRMADVARCTSARSKYRPGAPHQQWIMGTLQHTMAHVTGGKIYGTVTLQCAVQGVCECVWGHFVKSDKWVRSYQPLFGMLCLEIDIVFLIHFSQIQKAEFCYSGVFHTCRFFLTNVFTD